ncbi:uncharacterized protein LOC9647807 [Selaginella moellendorffii]|uniref:uncharacterized protein LOC9643392 n=1 Tax=Selaginella moellendorffii TaxID=88036 RepID=UPI000D1C975F|nr:uncharacterized protein LOC9643392 [Selaginella moellendorffii]XP_024542275.1 uncharacterized protein LOC9647807 [Selaginella moellendorffii]|eukprot:XP_024524062.1 uncharacterized protein LOC9643392 [Selaginella moellendorffii]
MLEADSGPPGLFPPGCFAPHSGDESGEEEELSVLPRHTKVIVTGNNRTKSVLVGLHGIVKKAVGLGGWHWLVLTNGAEVKLQRNALSVIEAPTGQEEDDDIDNPFSNETTPDDFPRTFKPRVRPQKPAAHEITRMADESKRSSERRCEFGLKTSQSQCVPVVDLGKLDTAALRRYRRHFKLFDVGPNSSKEQLLQAVSRHFVGQQLDELQVITGFVQAAKRPRM